MIKLIVSRKPEAEIRAFGLGCPYRREKRRHGGMHKNEHTLNLGEARGEAVVICALTELKCMGELCPRLKDVSFLDPATWLERYRNGGRAEW